MRPEGVQVEDISQDPPHQHIDLIYFAVPRPGWRPGPDGLPQVSPTYGMVWLDADATSRLPLTSEVSAWVARALHAVVD